jgi:hypothetical protein
VKKKRAALVSSSSDSVLGEEKSFERDQFCPNVIKSLNACKEVLIYDLEDIRRDLEMLTEDELEIKKASE